MKHSMYEYTQNEEEILTPGFHGTKCRHNGENPDYEIACDECEYFLLCFPEYDDDISKDVCLWSEFMTEDTSAT